MAGWHGGNMNAMFKMHKDFIPAPDARRFNISNFDPMHLARLETSLDIFLEAGGVESTYKKTHQIL